MSFESKTSFIPQWAPKIKKPRTMSGASFHVFPCAGIIRIRFNGYDLRNDKPAISWLLCWHNHKVDDIYHTTPSKLYYGAMLRLSMCAFCGFALQSESIPPPLDSPE
jgi:hypothetical protein